MTDAKDRDGALMRRAWLDGLLPPDDLTVTEWAERYRVLSGEGSIEPGPFSADKTPYVREILDSLHPNSGVRRVVWQKASQIGGSETANNWIGFLIDRFPGAIMMIQPNDELARVYSSTRLAPMLRDSPRLAEIMPKPKSRDADSSTLLKRFRGGVLLIRGANSAAGLRSQPIAKLIGDEIDNWPLDVDGEGDPLLLAEARLRWSGDRAKLFLLSSPKLKGNSRIEAAFESGDQRYYFVPCPHCKTKQRLQWKNLRWEKGKPESAQYVCEECGSLIDEKHKAEMLAKGEWRATAEPKDPGTRSFHLNSLYSPPGAFSWEACVRKWLEADESKSPFLLQVFVNTVLGETWAGTGEAPAAEQLYQRSRNAKYSSGFVPKGGLLLTAGVDVQKDRLECEVAAWGKNGQRWSIEYFILPGEHVLPEVWKRLDELLLRSWPHESGAEMQIVRMAIDAAFDQSVVAKWVRRQSPGRVLAVHGSDRLPVILGQPRRADVRRDGKLVKKGGFVLWPVGSSVAKTDLYGRLGIKPPVGDDPYPPGFCHFPKDYGLTYFEQLTAERLEFVHSRTGATKPQWVKTGRNEALDCAVYARAAAVAFGIDRFKDEHWANLAEELGVETEPAAAQAPNATTKRAPADEETPAPASREQPRSKRGGKWMSRWRDGPKLISRD